MHILAQSHLGRDEPKGETATLPAAELKSLRDELVQRRDIVKRIAKLAVEHGEKGIGEGEDLVRVVEGTFENIATLRALLSNLESDVREAAGEARESELLTKTSRALLAFHDDAAKHLGFAPVFPDNDVILRRLQDWGVDRQDLARILTCPVDSVRRRVLDLKSANDEAFHAQTSLAALVGAGVGTKWSAIVSALTLALRDRTGSESVKAREDLGKLRERLDKAFGSSSVLSTDQARVEEATSLAYHSTILGSLREKLRSAIGVPLATDHEIAKVVTTEFAKLATFEKELRTLRDGIATILGWDTLHNRTDYLEALRSRLGRDYQRTTMLRGCVVSLQTVVLGHVAPGYAVEMTVRFRGPSSEKIGPMFLKTVGIGPLPAHETRDELEVCW